MNGLTTKERLIKVETQIKDIRDDILDIKANHLPHIYDRLEKINWWLIGILTALVVNLAYMIIKG